MEKINIAKILEGCPKGTKLYSPVCGDCTLCLVGDCIIEVIDTNVNHYHFYYDGTYVKSGECLLFPSKEQRDWSKFQRPFKDGDIVFYSNTIAIFNEWGDETLFRTYCVLYTTVSNPMYQFEISIPLFGKGIRKEVRFATEKEKEKLFQAIKNNGYKWNAETKTLETPKSLEKLIKPWSIQDAKDGDILAFNDETIIIFKDLYNKTSFHSYCHIEEGIFTISKEDMPDWWEGKGFYPATEEQRTFLFRKIKEAGYKWNPETKTLDKLMKFKDGDIIYNRLQKKICIYYLCEDEVPRIRYCRYNESNIIWQFEKLEYPIPIAVQDYRLATEKEKAKLFQAIKDNGYKWNAKTKTLEKLIEPKFKVGNKIQCMDYKVKITAVNIEDECYEYESIFAKGIGSISFSEQDNWELVLDVKPIFKAGNIIQHKENSGWVCTIRRVENRYYVEGHPTCFTIPFDKQDEYELVFNKFDINTLVPFESKVLVRNYKSDYWKPATFGFIENGKNTLFCVEGGNFFNMCIPYEGNEHLISKTDDCDEYFKNW